MKAPPMTTRIDLVSRLRIKADMISLGERISWGSDSEIMHEAASALEAKDAEIARLRSILCECAAAIGNGAAMSPICSLEFMSHLPAEIVANAEKRKSRISDLERQLAEAMEVLEFYASPFEYVQNHRLDEQTPDFYDELNTGERAQNFLAAAAIRGGAK